MLDRLEDIEHARFRALAQLLIDKKEGAKAFEDYISVAFPSQAIRNKKKNDDIKVALQDWVKKGPMKVTPLIPLGKSKLKGRVTKVVQGRQNDIYKKLSNPLGHEND